MLVCDRMSKQCSGSEKSNTLLPSLETFLFPSKINGTYVQESPMIVPLVFVDFQRGFANVVRLTVIVYRLLYKPI